HWHSERYALRTSLDFLANPWNLWASERLEHNKAVLKLAFADRLAHVRDEGFRTPDLTLPFKVLADRMLARPTGETSNQLIEGMEGWQAYFSRIPTSRGGATAASVTRSMAHHLFT